MFSLDFLDRNRVFGFGVLDVLRFVGNRVIERHVLVQLVIPADKVIGSNHNVVVGGFGDALAPLLLTAHNGERS